jgi:DNA-binding CsgD family transcriptional regulator
MNFEEGIRRLTPSQLTILKLVCEGKTHLQIAEELGYAQVTVTWHMGHVYEKLGINDINMHWQARIRILKKEVCTLLVKHDIVLVPQKPEPVPEPPPDEVLAMVLHDEKYLVKLEPVQPPPIVPPPPNPIVRLLRYILFAIVALVTLAIVGIVSFGSGFRPFPQTSPAPQIITVVVTTISQNTPVSSPVPTQELPTLTLTASPTIEPTITPTREFYNQGEYAPLIEGVTMSLDETFSTPNYGSHTSDKSSFVIELRVKSEGGQQFVARFDPTNFYAKDDLGNDYPLVEVVTNGGFGKELIGIQNLISVGENLYVRFHGNWPLEAHYLIITVGPFNGKILVFHKSID